MPAKAKPAPKKVRKPMSEEAKQAMLEKRRATLAAKQVASSPRVEDCVGCKRCETACPTDFLSIRVYLQENEETQHHACS